MKKNKKTFYDWCIENDREDLLDRWSHELNNVDPRDVGYASGCKYYFNCSENKSHKPESIRLSHITRDNVQVKCKACNSFAQWCIDNMSNDFIDKYWHKTLNNDLDPWQIGWSSKKTIWLICHNGFDHYYSTSPHSFSRGTHECQVCNGQVVFCGFNDLFTTDPHLMSIWNFDKNTDISPYEISRGSGRKVWWKCDKCGNEWDAIISNIVKGRRCPVCAKRRQYDAFINNRLNNGFSFGDSFPQLLNMWNYQDNQDINPFEVFPASRKIASWKCNNNHYFKKSIVVMCKAFLNEDSLCRYCDGIGVIKGKNDLLTTYPELVKDWDYTKNTDCTPSTIAFGSTKRVWWKCHVCEHEWQAPPNARTNLRSGCPECARHFTISKLQKMVEEYIKNTYRYQILHERDCTIIATNPKTNYQLPYDNDVDVNGSKLIIEVHGEQHYNIGPFTITNASKKGITPQEELEYQQYKDEIKKVYALSKGYYFLEIPYTAIRHNEYQTLIDNKISEILLQQSKINVV